MGGPSFHMVSPSPFGLGSSFSRRLLFADAHALSCAASTSASRSQVGAASPPARRAGLQLRPLAAYRLVGTRPLGPKVRPGVSNSASIQPPLRPVAHARAAGR